MAQVKRTKEGRWLPDFEDQFCKRRRIKMKPGTTRNEALQELGKHLQEVERGHLYQQRRCPHLKTWQRLG